MSFNNGAGRYAPSPSGDLHFGNLRTAVLAWFWARSTARDFYLRVEDVDTQRSSRESAQRQIDDLAMLGIEWDGEVLYQSDRFGVYADAIERLAAQGRVYECYCSRKDIQNAASAPHGVPGEYPGTCRDLDEDRRTERREELRKAGRVPALRLRAEVGHWTIRDELAGRYEGVVDDFILRRGGNLNQGQDFAYNLAVVVDDGAQGIDQVVRGRDLLSSAPRQAYLAHLLGIREPTYVHVPLVVNRQGQRLAKRDGAVTLRQMLETMTVGDVVEMIGQSLGLERVRELAQLVDIFNPESIPRGDVTWPL